MKLDPADSWDDPRWRRWFAESDAREEQRRVALNGRESFGEAQLPAGVSIAVAVVKLPIVLSHKRIGQPAATPGERTCVDCIAVDIHEEPKMKTSTFVSTKGFSHLGVMRATSPFPDHKVSDFKDGRGDGMPMKPARDVAAVDDDLAECCKNGSLEHLTRARDAIGREIQRRAGAKKVLRFAK